MRTVEFFFDYASPYSYIANELLATALPGIPIVYRSIYLRGFEPFAKGVPFSAPKLAWIVRDIQRCAEEHGLSIRLPASFPVNGLYALRGAIAAQRANRFDRYHSAMFRAIWRDGREASTRDGAASIARELGVELTDDPSIKDELRTSTEAAGKRGVFGVPTFLVGDDLFWGHDRMHQVARAAMLPAC